MKRAPELAGLRSLSTMGLSAEMFIPALLEMLHGVIPSLRNLFGWVGPAGNLVRFYVEGPIEQAVAARYFEEFHDRREGEVMPTFHQAVQGRSVIRSAQELENPAFYRSALYKEIWRPLGLHTRLAAVIKGSSGQPLGSLVLYRGKSDRSFTREDEVLLTQVARYVARGLEVPSAALMTDDFVSRRDCRAMLSLAPDGELMHLSADALKMLLLSHGGLTPDNVSRSPRREDFPTLSMLWQHPGRSTGRSAQNITLTVENAWGRFVYESTPMQALATGQPPVNHVNIHQQEPRGLAIHRVLEALPLSPAQREVCALLHLGRATSDIAASLAIAPSTVADHVKKIYARLDVHSVHELSVRINQRLGQ